MILEPSARHSPRLLLRLAGIGALLLSCPNAHAGEGRTFHATGYGSTWIETRLPDLPEDLFKGDVETRDQHFVGGAVNYVALPDLSAVAPFGTDLFLDWKLELEGQLVRHFGFDDHLEATAALLLRTPTLDLPGGLSVNFAVAEGFSYAFEEPLFEAADGRAEPTQFLNYLAFEAELTHETLPNLHLVPRLHHRSGVFGLVGPLHTGANFAGLGLRVDLD